MILQIKRRPRNPGITLLLIIAVCTPQIAAKTAANAQMSPLILLLTATAVPYGGVTAQSPLLAPFNLFKTFFKNNPLSNFRSSTSSPPQPLAPPPHRQNRFLPFVNVNNNNNDKNRFRHSQQHHSPNTAFDRHPDFTPSEPITSFNNQVFTVVKPVKKPKKSIIKPVKSSFVKTSFVKNKPSNSFTKFDSSTRSKTGFTQSSSNSNSKTSFTQASSSSTGVGKTSFAPASTSSIRGRTSFKSSTPLAVQNQFFTTEKTSFTGTKKPYPTFSNNIVSSTFVQTATEIPINPTYSPTEDFINLPFSYNTRQKQPGDPLGYEFLKKQNNVKNSQTFESINEINTQFDTNNDLPRFTDFSRPSSETASGPNPAGSLGISGNSGNRFFDDLTYRGARYYDGYNDATITDTKTGVSYTNVYNAGSFYQDSNPSSSLISEKDYSKGEKDDDLLYVEFEELQVEKNDVRRGIHNHSDNYCGGASDLGFCALDPSDEIFSQSEIPIDFFNQLDTNRIGFKSLPQDVSVINIDNLLKKCQHIVDMFEAHFVPNVEELRGQHDLDHLEDLGNPWSWQTYQRNKQQLCQSEFSFILPNYAKDIQGVWHRIVNTKTLQQKVGIDMCRKPGDPCPGLADCGRRSVCVQQYGYQFLLAVPPQLTDCPKLRAFKFPSGCSCHTE